MIPIEEKKVEFYPASLKGFTTRQSSQRAQKRISITKKKPKISKSTENQLVSKRVSNFKQCDHLEKIKTFEMKDDNENLYTLEIFQDNYLLLIQFKDKEIIFDLTAEDENKKLRNFERKIYFEENESTNPLSFVISKEWLREIFKNEKNYELRINSRLLILKWELVSENFRKQVFQRIVFDQMPIQQVNNLKLQVFSLRKRISEMEKQQPLLSSSFQFLNQTNKKIKKREIQKIKLEVDEEKLIILDDEEKELNANNFQNKQHMSRYRLKKKRIKKSKKKQEYLIIAEESKKKQDKKIPMKKYRKRRGRGKKVPNIQSMINLKDYQEQYRADKQPYEKQNKEQVEGERIKNSIIELQSQQEQQNSNFYCDYQKKVVGEKIKFIFENGDYYFGQVAGKKYHGKGKYFSKQNGQIFQGTWIQGVVYGQGRRIDKDHNISYGFFIKGKREGKGIDQYENGQRYQGQFLNDVRSGFGIYCYEDKSYYKGEWKNDQCHGHGCEYYSDGSYYEGKWFEDQKHGEGKFYIENKIYKQDYMNGVLISEFLFKDMNQKEMEQYKSIKDY